MAKVKEVTGVVPDEAVLRHRLAVSAGLVVGLDDQDLGSATADPRGFFAEPVGE